MPIPVSQYEYVTYTRYLKEIKVIEKCCSSDNLSKVGFLNGHFVKIAPEHKSLNSFIPFDKSSQEQLNQLKNRVKFINTIHDRLKQGELGERKSDDCAPLAAESYNTHLKTLSAWNKIFPKEELHINFVTDEANTLNPEFSEQSIAQATDEKALNRYFELLEKYPKLKRDESLNDYKKGVYQMIYDRAEISAIRQEVYQRLYTKAKSQGLSDSQADDLATNFSRPGVVCEDQFWLWIRDVVISPQGYKHTYNRILWKSELDRIGGAAALPLVIDKEGNNKLIVQLAFRHATNSWEFEMPRGGSKPNESPEETARREILEESGCETHDLMALGSMTPDTGLNGSVVPIFLGKVVREKETKHDKTEAIKGKYAFTLLELMEGLKRGYIEVEINHQMTQVPIRDPFLTYALLMAQYNNQL